ncbi:cyclin [Pichia kluyveri]|uniref:Cyclin n=1 Tax=Pichia kluyveri TaxID=36015 RepID=A0AAV5R4S1_PICKL|nr:cyclin [Pichia kluyveri]
MQSTISASNQSSIPIPSRKSYGPPRRPITKPYSTKLESIENFKNKLITAEYLPSINEHFKYLESSSSVNPSMIDLQPEVKWYMRPYLVNFIIQMHSSLRLKPQTLFLCWNIIDRYCAKRIAFKQHYQLIGCTSLWIASKYEDKKSRVPNIKELNTMCSNVYDDSMFKEMEIHILSTLNWSIGHTTLEDILQLAVKFSDPDGKELLNKPLHLYKGNTPTVSAILAVSRYLCELSLYKRNFLNYSTSLIGISSFLMACSILNMNVGSNFLNNIYQNFESYINDNDNNTKNNNNNNNNNKIDNDDDNKLFGPFISGFNGIDTINEIRKITIELFKSLLNPSEVLIEKYTPLGVIAVVKKFIEENELYQIDLSIIETTIPNSNNESTEIESVIQLHNPYCFELSNLLLAFDESCSFNISNLNNFRDYSLISSSDSIFTTPCDSPSNFSSFSSISSNTSYSNNEFSLLNDYKEKLI